jgi:two-component system LytT family response regulator
MMRVAIIDDEPLARSGVRARLARHQDIVVVAEFGDGVSALAGLADARPDLLFVDIQMPGMDGLTLLASLDAGLRPMAILLTAYDEFALRAFRLNVLDYLLKPIDDERLAEALDRARQALPYRGLGAAPLRDAARPSYLETFTVRVGTRLTFVHADDVLWIGAEGDYACLHTTSHEHLLRESLNRLAQQLDPAQFVRIHRSTIVRVGCIAELRTLANRDAMLRLTNGTPLRGSRTYLDTLTDAMRRQRSKQ